VLAYVHDLDPVIWDIWRGVKLRWYGLAYLLAFLVAYYLLCYLSRKKLWVIVEKNIGDFIALLAMIGVFIGGRLGYVLFYMIPEHGWGPIAQDPLSIIRVWDGGMASHGGFLGVALFTLYYARKHKISWTGIGDGICIVAPLGLMFGRLANFINGELYGRVAAQLPWGVKFPQAFQEESYLVRETVITEIADRAPLIYEKMNQGMELSEAVRLSPEVKQICAEHLTARHPSQLYEGFCEGAFLFGLMWFLRFRYPRAPHGMICGIFFILYGVLRTIVEHYREPDSSRIGPFTKGQFYSLFMVLAGIAFLVNAWRNRKTTPVFC
jgi:phosphatidylglycerol:prolipoprotein diacylglycerol transferase